MPEETILQMNVRQPQIQPDQTNWRKWTKFGLLALGLPVGYLLARTTGVGSWISSFFTEDNEGDALTTTEEGQLSAFIQQPLAEVNEEIPEIFSPAVIKEDGLKLAEFKELPLSEHVHQKRDSLSIPTDGLIAWYPLDSIWGVGDASGNGNNGTLMGSPPPFLTTDRFGNPTGAYEIAGNVGYYGSDIYIDLPSSTETINGLTNVTLNIWVQERSKTYPERAFYISFGHANPVLDYPIVGIENGDDNLFEGVNLVYSNTNTYGIVELVPFTNKTAVDFRFYSFVYDGTNGVTKGYVNGDLAVSTSIITSGPILAEGWSAIGKYWRGAPFQYTRLNMIADDVRIYGRALTDEEIKALYHEGDWDLTNTPSPTTTSVVTTTPIPSETLIPTTTQTASPTVTTLFPTTTVSPTQTTGSSANSTVTPTTNPSTTTIHSSPAPTTPTASSSSGALSTLLSSSSSQVSTSVVPPESSSNTPITPTSSGHVPANNMGIIVGGAAGGAGFLMVVGGTLVAFTLVKRRNGNRHDNIPLANVVTDEAAPAEAAKPSNGFGNGSGNGSREFVYVDMGDGEPVQVQRIQERKIKLVETIGTGSFGTVSIAKWSSSNVAVKVLHTHLLEDPQTIKSCEKEAAILSGLRHENTVGLFGMFETFKHNKLVSLGIVMQLASVGSLNTVLEDQMQRFSFLDCLQIGLGMMNGLDYLHKKDIWHRDLKPGNILVHEGPDGLTALLTDFGDAKVFSAEQKQMTKGVGTLCWTAPEILKGKKYTGKADVFSCGIIFCQFATRKLDPYEDDMDQFVIAERIREGGRPEIPATCDEGFARLIQWFWAQDPDQRPNMKQARKAFSDYRESYNPT